MEEALYFELVQKVRDLYDSVPGTQPQRDADRWLTNLVGLDAAWAVLLHTIGTASSSSAPVPQQQQQQTPDVRLVFIAAKILQVRLFKRLKLS